MVKPLQPMPGRVYRQTDPHLYQIHLLKTGVFTPEQLRHAAVSVVELCDYDKDLVAVMLEALDLQPPVRKKEL